VVAAAEPATKIKQLAALAERLGCTLHQLAVAWTIKNQTNQCCVVSASTPDQLTELLGCLSVDLNLLYSFTKKISQVSFNPIVVALHNSI